MTSTAILGPALTGASTDFLAEITASVGAALPIALPVVALFVGWRIFKRFAKA